MLITIVIPKGAPFLQAKPRGDEWEEESGGDWASRREEKEKEKPGSKHAGGQLSSVRCVEGSSPSSWSKKYVASGDAEEHAAAAAAAAVWDEGREESRICLAWRRRVRLTAASVACPLLHPLHLSHSLLRPACA